MPQKPDKREKPETIENPRRFLLDAYAAGLRAVEPRRAVRDALRADTSTTASAARKIHLLAIGKAASGMCAGALDVLGERVNRALVILPDNAVAPPPGVETLHAGHPLPDSRSLAAGRRVLEEVSTTDCDLLLLLISGGASSLLDVRAAPLLDEELLDIHRELFAMGLPIRQWNAVRQRLSALKAGGLLACLPAGVICRQLLVSDVPGDGSGDDPAIIGSGLAVPLEHPPRLPDLPASIIDILPPWEPRRHADVETEIVASNAMLLDAVEEFAQRRDVVVRVRGELRGDAGEMARQCVAELRNSEPGLYLRGGETTVQLPSNSPPGGRNQHFALTAAIELAGRDDIFLLAAGTDGVDGNTEEAGAMVDGGSLRRGELDGIDASECLAGFRSHNFLAGSGDLLHTGPSGTNVMDVVLAFRK